MNSFKKIAKISKYAAFAAIFSVALSGCSLTGSKTPTADPALKNIVIWSFEDEDIWKPIIQSFEGRGGGISIIYQKQTFDANYENRVLNSMMSSSKPDIWAMPSDWVYRHKDKLSPMPAPTAKNAETAINLDNFIPSVRQSVEFDNKIYALAPAAEPLMVYYNEELFASTLADFGSQAEEHARDLQSKDQYTEAIAAQTKADLEKKNRLLSQPPLLWNDLIETANILTKKNGTNITQSGLAIGTSNIVNSQDILYLLMMQNETDILANNLKLATFNLPKQTSVGTNDLPGKRALEFYTSFANPNSSNYTWNDSFGNNIDAFGNGKAAMVFGYSSLQNVLLQKYPNLKYKKAFVPQVSQDSNKIVDYARFTAFGVNGLSLNPTASWQFINDLMANADTYNSALRLYTSQAGDSSAGEEKILINRTAGDPEHFALLTAKSLVKGRFPADFDTQMRQTITSVNTGIQDSKTALDLASNNITELLRKDDW